MTSRRPLLFAALAALAVAVLAGPALAQEVTPEQRDALSARVEEFGAVMDSGDMAGLLAFTPPPVRATLAEMSGLSEQELTEAMRQASEAMLAGATIDDFGMDVEGATAAATPDGARTYLLVPTTTEVTVNGQGSLRTSSQTLALEDDGEWWLVRVEDPQQAMILAQAYPEFTGVAFPPATVEPIQ
jgi:hypothetical protein